MRSFIPGGVTEVLCSTELKIFSSATSITSIQGWKKRSGFCRTAHAFAPIHPMPGGGNRPDRASWRDMPRGVPSSSFSSRLILAREKHVPPISEASRGSNLTTCRADAKSQPRQLDPDHNVQRFADSKLTQCTPSSPSPPTNACATTVTAAHAHGHIDQRLHCYGAWLSRRMAQPQAQDIVPGGSLAGRR